MICDCKCEDEFIGECAVCLDASIGLRSEAWLIKHFVAYGMQT